MRARIGSKHSNQGEVCVYKHTLRDFESLEHRFRVYYLDSIKTRYNNFVHFDFYQVNQTGLHRIYPRTQVGEFLSKIFTAALDQTELLINISKTYNFHLPNG